MKQKPRKQQGRGAENRRKGKTGGAWFCRGNRPEVKEEESTETKAEIQKEESKVEDAASAKPVGGSCRSKTRGRKGRGKDRGKTEAKEKAVAAPLVEAAVDEKTEPEPEKKTAAEAHPRRWQRFIMDEGHPGVQGC